MTLAAQLSLHTTNYLIDFTEDAEAEVLEGTAEALALEEAAGLTEAGDFVYSATAEGLGGEVAGPEGIDLDEEPGLIYSGPTGAKIRVQFNNLDIVETDDEAPEATDSWTAGVFVNNKLVALCDEGFVAELDTQTAAELNLENGVGVQLTELDVIRIGLISAVGNEDDQTVDVAEGGTLVIAGG